MVSRCKGLASCTYHPVKAFCAASVEAELCGRGICGSRYCMSNSFGNGLLVGHDLTCATYFQVVVDFHRLKSLWS
ncbi:hypothetical protein Sjap_020572 [Stephania japonica]|uniref:Uncharacterized protein n=1 Tax=Stephania japonica TaxID=461633 RepID=A0AAP0HVP4_9MAGN